MRRERSDEAEWMDTEAVSPEDFAACLADLATVNTVTLARLPTLGFLRRVMRRHGRAGRALRILDVGCGEGDMLRRIHRWARRGGHAVELVGLDLNALGVAAARAATPDAMGIEYRIADVFGAESESFDVIISSLFTHHLSDAQVVAFIQVMEARAGLGWFINDLQRHVIAEQGFRVLSALAGWHRFVRHDGPLSVARSFRRGEWGRALRAAGVAEVAELRWHMPFRLCVSRFK